MAEPKPRPWLVAAWPGMGNVAVIAAGYLAQKLGMKPVAELPPRGHFDIQQVDVKGGVVEAPHLPRSVFYRWVNPSGRDLIIFLGESQPSTGAYAFAHELLDKATDLGVERVITFASMASQLHPTQQPKVYAVATDRDMLSELKSLDVHALSEGQIAGLNGVLLGAAADRGLTGVCLLGEIPFFAAGVPNPKAAKAVLDAFTALAGIELELSELTRHAETVDEALLGLLEKMKEQAAEAGEEGALFELSPEDDDDDEETTVEVETPQPEPPKEKPLDLATRNRIEKLFEDARRDRNRAMRLKEELDRLGVFNRYEDRFLDLFRRGE